MDRRTAPIAGGRLLTIGLVLIVALVLAACGDNEGSSPTTSDEDDQEVEPDDDEEIVALEPEVEVGDSLADVEMTLLNGDTVTIGDYAGKVMMLFFWSTDMQAWIVRQLAVHHAFLGDEGLVVFGVNSTGEPVGSIENFVDEFPNELPIVLDEDGHLMDLFAAGLATTVWIGPESDLKSITRTFKQADLIEENIRYKLDAYLGVGEE